MGPGATAGKQRDRAQQAYYAKHPERFRRQPRTPTPAGIVGINLPKDDPDRRPRPTPSSSTTPAPASQAACGPTCHQFVQQARSSQHPTRRCWPQAPQARKAWASCADRLLTSAKVPLLTVPSGCRVRTRAEPWMAVPWRTIAPVASGAFIIVLCI